MAAERGDDNDEHGGQRMQIKGKAEGKSASAHIVDGERLGEAPDAVKPSEPTTNGCGDEAYLRHGNEAGQGGFAPAGRRAQPQWDPWLHHRWDLR